jgi:hypothetical protein
MVVFVPVSRFPLGEILLTSTVVGLVSEKDIQKAIFKHALGESGDFSEEARVESKMAIETGARVTSKHESADGIKFLIVTEPDRSATTVFLPEDL